MNLHPELAACLEKMNVLGMEMIRHPLLFAVPYFGKDDNERLNQLLEFRKKQAAEFLEQQEYNRFVFTHERPYRLDSLMQIQSMLTDAELAPLLLSVYVDSENIGQNYDVWSLLLEPFVGKDPWNTLHELPHDTFQIWRGGSRDGFSWTTDVKVAHWFANRWKQELPVWTATVSKSDVIGFYDGRGEKEVIVHPDYISHLIDKLD